MTDEEKEVYDNELLYENKKNFQKDTINGLTLLNTFLTYVYFLCILVISYTLFTKYDYSFIIKILIIIALALYPFVIYLLESNAYNVGVYLWSFITGEPYVPMKNYSYLYTKH
uniref:Uncharacterized protein n=1 Tax=viral metagenome TaxID=1070528 RepID=A0A6C0J3Q6_9ZZZZ